MCLLLGQTETRFRFGNFDLIAVANPPKNKYQDGAQRDKRENPFHGSARSCLSERDLVTSAMRRPAEIARSLQLVP
jgi:hypothetical protein